MESKQVNVHMQGIYHFCPHCKSHMKIEYHANYCPDCGGELLWDDVNEYNKIIHAHCPYEDTDDNCKYYKSGCVGSKNCNYVNSTDWLKLNAGKLTYSERQRLLFDKGWW